MTEVLVVDDSKFMRSIVSDALNERGIDVIDEAKNGEEAVEKVERLNPDVVTMDVEMPKMNGIEAVETIMNRSPTPIIMLSAHTSEGAEKTIEALEKGAVDFLPKPSGEVSVVGMEETGEKLAKKIRNVSSVSLNKDTEKNTETEINEYNVQRSTVVIGSSAGGPKTLESILSDLPRADIRLLLVQHMPEGFTEKFADRLNEISEYSIREARNQAYIQGGQGLVAKGDFHMRVKNYSRGKLQVEISKDDLVNNIRPSIDVTMESAAEKITDDRLMGVVLTGIGKDGAKGIASIKEHGGDTIAQDENTSQVFGIPAKAIETGKVDKILPLEEIPQKIIETLSKD